MILPSFGKTSRVWIGRLLAILLFTTHAAIADELGDFRKRVTEYAWEWRPGDPNAGTSPWDKVEFKAGGDFAASKGGKPVFSSKWQAKAPGTIEIMKEDAVGLVLTFDGYWLACTAATPAGKRTGKGEIMGWKGLTVAPARLLAQDKGGKSATMADLGAILKDYGAPKVDINPRDGVDVYRGPRLTGAVVEVKIPYLTDRTEAEKILFERTPAVPSKIKAVAPGFPDGLELVSYNINFNGFTRVTLVTDRSSRVVAVQLKAPNRGHNAEGEKGWRRLERDFHAFDFVGTEERGRAGLGILCHIYDSRKNGGFIVFQTLVPAQEETTRCYLPTPMIDLILSNIKDAGVRVAE